MPDSKPGKAREVKWEVMLGVMVSSDAKAQVEAYAAEQGVSTATVVRWAIRDYIETKGLV